MRYECLYGNPRLLKKIYRGSLKCLKSDLKSSIIEEFEKIKAENVYVLITVKTKLLTTRYLMFFHFVFSFCFVIKECHSTN